MPWDKSVHADEQWS